ncbi:MAG: hypothetical protein ACXWDO_11835, partial [Bacteroidia bacterium]
MKKIILLTALPLLFALASCERMNDKNDTDGHDTVMTDTDAGKDTIVVLHDRVEREKSEYRIEAQRDIDSTQSYIDRMDKKMESAGAKAKAEWKETKAKLQTRLDRAKADLNEFGTKADNEWDE